MKKFILLISFYCLTAITVTSHGFSIRKTSTINDPAGVFQELSANQLLDLSVKQFSSITGKKMNVWERISFSIMKIKRKHELKKYPGITSKTFNQTKSKHRMGAGWWIVIGIFALFIIGLIAFKESAQ